MNALRRILFVLLGLALIVGPALWRVGMGYSVRSYVPPQALSTTVAATPVPTATTVALALPVAGTSAEMRSGPVVVDLAHGNRLNRSQYEPLAAALARHGVGLRFWISEIDVLEITNFLDYPDQSEALAALLKDASALVVGSPFFLWSGEEIALVDRFVADGGAAAGGERPGYDRRFCAGGQRPC